MKKLAIFSLSFLIFAVMASSAEATTTKRTGSGVSLAADESVIGNFYAVGNTVAITGTVTGDVLVAGGNVTMNGTVEEDVLIAGGTVAVSGSTTGDVRVVAGEVTIAGTIGGNLSVIGGRVKILSTATIAGDVMIYGGEAIVEGEVKGFLYGTTESLRIDGTVVAGVDVTTQALRLGNRSKVTGNITYVSSAEVIRASEAQVGGSIVRNSPTNVETSFSFRPLVVHYLVVLFTVLVAYLLFRLRLERFVDSPLFHPQAVLKAVLFGFLILFLPVAVAVLLTSVLGILVGLIVLFGYLLLLTLAIPLMTFVVAKVLMRLANQSTLTLLHLVIATVIATGLLYIPVVGISLALALYILTVGSVAQYLLGRIRR